MLNWDTCSATNILVNLCVVCMHDIVYCGGKVVWFSQINQLP